ncbi:MAG TPA: hypothetical protein VMX18_02040 [Candidatus Bipolaricaulota bacterium]|nr:hypothetical protein [Candidatus Bipolaricaulota bacterium]
MPDNEKVSKNNAGLSKGEYIKSIIKRGIFILLIVFIIWVLFLPKTSLISFFASSDKSCDSFFPYPLTYFMPGPDQGKMIKQADANISCKKKVSEGRTLFTFWRGNKALKDSACENEEYELRQVCYFKKAVDNREPRYCGNLVSKDFCLMQLAVKIQDSLVCGPVNELYAKRCIQLANECKSSIGADPGCKMMSQFLCPPYYESDYEISKKRAIRCVQKYGNEYKGIPLELESK